MPEHYQESDEGEENGKCKDGTKSKDRCDANKLHNGKKAPEERLHSISPYMARQAQRASITSLSPMEEMKLVQGELQAKAAKKLVGQIINHDIIRIILRCQFL